MKDYESNKCVNLPLGWEMSLISWFLFNFITHIDKNSLTFEKCYFIPVQISYASLLANQMGLELALTGSLYFHKSKKGGTNIIFWIHFQKDRS